MYELTFGLFIKPDRSQRQMLFMVTNEKQEAVDPNLLYYLQDQLGLLNERGEPGGYLRHQRQLPQ